MIKINLKLGSLMFLSVVLKHLLIVISMFEFFLVVMGFCGLVKVVIGW
jgi:hypothetical protein